jgi:hypothetical protein
MVHVSDADESNFKMCRGCWACKKTGTCVCGDDYVKEILEKIKEADAVIASLLGPANLNCSDCLHIFEKIQEIYIVIVFFTIYAFFTLLCKQQGFQR